MASRSGMWENQKLFTEASRSPLMIFPSPPATGGILLAVDVERYRGVLVVNRLLLLLLA